MFLGIVIFHIYHNETYYFNWIAEVNGQDEKPLDPRAGRVDVVMPEIVFDATEVAKILENIKYKKFTRVKNRKTIDRVISTWVSVV